MVGRALSGAWPAPPRHFGRRAPPGRTIRRRRESPSGAGPIPQGLTGCSVVLCPQGAVVAADVRGGAPGTRETDLARPGMLVEQAQAVLLTGGSAFGLDARRGVDALARRARLRLPRRRGRRPHRPRRRRLRPGAWGASAPARARADGYAACEGAGPEVVRAPRRERGRRHRLHRGQALRPRPGPCAGGRERPPSARRRLGRGARVTVGALVAVNAVGDVYEPDSGAPHRRRPPAGRQPGRARRLAPPPAGAPTGPAPAPAGALAPQHHHRRGRHGRPPHPEQAQRVAWMAQDGLARAVRPAHTPATATPSSSSPPAQPPLARPAGAPARLSAIGAAGAEAVALAVVRAVRAADAPAPPPRRRPVAARAAQHRNAAAWTPPDLAGEHPAVIALLTDFGRGDAYAGVLHGVVAGIAPHTRVVDLATRCPPQDVRAGAFLLLTSYRFFPAGNDLRRRRRSRRGHRSGRSSPCAPGAHLRRPGQRPPALGGGGRRARAGGGARRGAPLPPVPGEPHLPRAGRDRPRRGPPLPGGAPLRPRPARRRPSPATPFPHPRRRRGHAQRARCSTSTASGTPSPTSLPFPARCASRGASRAGCEPTPRGDRGSPSPSTAAPDCLEVAAGGGSAAADAGHHAGHNRDTHPHDPHPARRALDHGARA